MTHTLEVTQVGRTIARALGLNEMLVEAIGMGHDLGHTPFGHAGERICASSFQVASSRSPEPALVETLAANGHG